MSDTPWAFDAESAPLGPPDSLVTLIEGSSFCLSARNGDIEPGTPHGLFFLDTRFLSEFVLEIDGSRLESLSVAREEPFAATYLGRIPPGSAPDGTVAVFRRRSVGDGLVETITIRNYGMAARSVAVCLRVQADMADLFAVKERRAPRIDRTPGTRNPSLIEFRSSGGGSRRATTIVVSTPGRVDGATLNWPVTLPPRGEWTVCVEVTGSVDERLVEPRLRCGQPLDEARPVRRLHEWRNRVPLVDTDHVALASAIRQTSEDLGALQLVDPAHPDDVVIAAGAPWFMTLFGRDSLLTAYMALIVDPALALGVLRSLARLQGERTDAETEEEPGRVLHEIRFHDRPAWTFAEGTAYYGSIDATPLFVVLLGELRRWGLASDAVDHLLPHADRALAWIETHGDRDGDGYVEYQRATPNGLANQGWKDSWDGITFADGTLPEGPIALCEVQGYVYAAFLARAYFALELDDHRTADHYRARAAELKQQFNRDFWLEDRGYFAVALDGQKRPVDSLASNMGHCLWSGIVDEEKAPAVAAALMSPAMFSGWGVRTLGTSMAAYNPLSYHNGSVWPHDNAIVAAGLGRYGFTAEAHRIIDAMLDVSTHYGGRLPELLGGFARDELATPAAYPTSCIPQAWSAASPLLFLRTLLRFDPWITHGKLWVSPELPETMSHLAVARIPLDGHRVSIDATLGDLTVHGVGDHIEVITAARSATTALLDG